MTTLKLLNILFQGLRLVLKFGVFGLDFKKLLLKLLVELLKLVVGLFY